MVRSFFFVIVQLMTLAIRVLDALHLGLTIAIGHRYLVDGFENINVLQVVPGCVS